MEAAAAAVVVAVAFAVAVFPPFSAASAASSTSFAAPLLPFPFSPAQTPAPDCEAPQTPGSLSA